ncbi:hypothetical protein SAMN05421759_10456 [Roseivivax lentus]|uniref:Uncharacterized protein n=1 Tax=Roseivivax lentus TaxID=633194 RepID=A0A1N7M7M5_9RHOB|nr:hypothetical protein [Roseivivax lentus]SIS82080.1 hypothetical protein SAMN05421759_10456 [Roseivivax lentus]
MIDPILTYIEQRLARDLDAAQTLRSGGLERSMRREKRVAARPRFRAAR